MKSIIFFSLLLSVCIWIGCSKPNTDFTNQQNKPVHSLGNAAYYGSCDSVYCTMEIVCISVDVANNAGNPVILDSFYTADNNGRMSNVLYGTNGTPGSYMIFNDSWVNGHQKTVLSVRFIGFKNGLKIVDEPYNIATDCCHVKRSSGKTQVIIP